MQRSEQLEKLPHIDFEVANRCCSAALHHKITVTGAEVNGVGVYFTIKSTERQGQYWLVFCVDFRECNIFAKKSGIDSSSILVFTVLHLTNQNTGFHSTQWPASQSEPALRVFYTAP